MRAILAPWMRWVGGGYITSPEPPTYTYSPVRCAGADRQMDTRTTHTPSLPYLPPSQQRWVSAPAWLASATRVGRPAVAQGRWAA